MALRKSSAATAPLLLGELPCDPRTWRRVAEDLALSPQQERIVELILRGKQDREIATELALTVPTVRTYLTRTYRRVDVPDRMHLVLRIFSIAQSIVTGRHRH
jgi:DNA-binding NarL/FixJ family response regulator